MDIWLDVAPNEMHYVASIIPTLKWRGGKLGVRLALLPKDVSNLFNEYREAYSSARTTEHARTTRLFYVACTRAQKSLAIIAYTYDCEAVKATAMKNNWFEDDEIRLLE